MLRRQVFTVVRWSIRRRRQAIALGLLAVVAITSLGMALPVSVRKLAAELYPCMHCSCGCANAEMCWRDCCCYTNEQKIAWARQNGVTPPAYVLAVIKKPVCCRKKLASCCVSKCGCCEKVAAKAEPMLVWRKHRKTSERKAKSIVLLQTLRCQGLSSHWTLLPPTVMPALPAVGEAPVGLVNCISVVDISWKGELSPPELPPPQNDV